VKRFTLFSVQGGPFERGRQYGARAAGSIAANVQAYLRLVEFHTGRHREASLAAARSFAPLVETHAPQLLEEMRGIAAGAGRSLDEILLINARSELMGTIPTGECTSLAAGPGFTAGGQVLLGQNWDWYTAIDVEPVLLEIRQDGAPDILTVAEAGQVGKIGMNSAGLGVCLNFLQHTDQGQGLPIHVILRQMLGCAGLGEAIHEAYRVPRGGSANVLLAHAEGDLLDLELTPLDAGFIYGDAGWLVHANHFESPRLGVGDAGLATSMSTLARAARARRLLARTVGHASEETFREILKDHAYGAYAICRHPDPSEADLQQTATRASLIMDLSAGTLQVAAGQPCREEYHTIRFYNSLAPVRPCD
jgi:isopenicillin-N N-acyltransferase-like protein